MLVDRTEGWPAGLYLAASGSVSSKIRRRGVRDFHGDHRHVVEYLTGEVLDALDPDTRQFLLRDVGPRPFQPRAVRRGLGPPSLHALLGELEHARISFSSDWTRTANGSATTTCSESCFSSSSASSILPRHGSSICRRVRGAGSAASSKRRSTTRIAAGDDASVAAMLAERHIDLMRTGRQATLLKWLAVLSRARFSSARPRFSRRDRVWAARTGSRGTPSVHRAGKQAAMRGRSDWTPYHETGLGLALGILGQARHRCRGADRRGRRRTSAARSTWLPFRPLASLGFLLFPTGSCRGASQSADAVERPSARVAAPWRGLCAATLALCREAVNGMSVKAESKARQARRPPRRSGAAETASGGLARLALAAALSASDASQTPSARPCAVSASGGRPARCRRTSMPCSCWPISGFERGQLSRASRTSNAPAGARGLSGSRRALPELADGVERGSTRGSRHGNSRSAPSAAELSVLRLLAADLSQREIGRSSTCR